MKEKNNLRALLVAIILIVAGTLSPSNGVDEGSCKTPLQLITTMFIIIAIALGVYFIWVLVEKHKKVLKENEQLNN